MVTTRPQIFVAVSWYVRVVTNSSIQDNSLLSCYAMFREDKLICTPITAMFGNRMHHRTGACGACIMESCVIAR